MHGVMGGLERQIIEIGKIFSGSGYSVFVVTLDVGDVTLFYQDLPEKIVFIPLNVGSPDEPASFLVKLKRQRRILETLRVIEPDIGIAFMFGGFLMSRLGMFVIKKPLILAERNSPKMYLLTRIARFRYLLFLSMSLASRITVQFDSYISMYPWFLRSKIQTIPNTILDIGALVSTRNKNVRFVFAGRFSFQKQVLRLIDAFHEFHKNYPQSSLTFFGEGEQKSQMLEKIQELGLYDSITINKPTDLRGILRETDVMCVPSKWEGFPNILAESLKAGIPAIGFSNCDGVSDLIQDNVNGWLEKDSGNQVELVRLLDRSYHDIRRRKLVKEQIRLSMNRYDNQQIAGVWRELAGNLTIDENTR